MKLLSSMLCFCAVVVATPFFAEGESLTAAEQARLSKSASQNAEALQRSNQILRAVLREADPKTLLIPNFFMEKPPKKLERLNRTRYSPFNSAADLYGYLVIGSYFVAPELYAGRMREMLFNEKLFTSAERSIPGEYSIRREERGGPSLFGAGEYAKDGLISITEVVGKSPWHERMEEMMFDLMALAPVASDFGNLPSTDTELNGDVLQVLPRLYWFSGDQRFLRLNRRISDAYFTEVLPRSNFLPRARWNFMKHRGAGPVRLRDHGNETIVGLMLSTVMEILLQSDRAKPYLEASTSMIDRVLSSANEDGMLHNEIDYASLAPIDTGLADNWGYVYGAVYNLYLVSGDEKYRRAIENVLNALPKYRGYPWEGQHYDGYADSIESAIYLVSRIPNEGANQWIDDEMPNIWRQQRGDGHADGSYLEGNFIRTSLLYALMKSQGVSALQWQDGLGIGAIPKKGGLHMRIIPPLGGASWSGRVRFDIARHREIFHLPKNFIRLNEFPEWFTVQRHGKYRIVKRAEAPHASRGEVERTASGDELAAGIELSDGDWELSPIEDGLQKRKSVTPSK